MKQGNFKPKQKYEVQEMPSESLFSWDLQLSVIVSRDLEMSSNLLDFSLINIHKLDFCLQKSFTSSVAPKKCHARKLARCLTNIFQKQAPYSLNNISKHRSKNVCWNLKRYKVWKGTFQNPLYKSIESLFIS